MTWGELGFFALWMPLAVVSGCDSGTITPCANDQDCSPGLVCQQGICEAPCAPSCVGKCAFSNDGCNGTCNADCPKGLWCDSQAQVCRQCQRADRCGPDCIDCSQQYNDKVCVDGGDSGFRCGCGSDADCDSQETCQENMRCSGCTPNWVDVGNCDCTPGGCLGCSGIKKQDDGCGHVRDLVCSLPATGCNAGCCLEQCCPAGQVCYLDACCDPESDSQFCVRQNQRCGELSANDNCGTARAVDCGDCMDYPNSFCNAGTCDCARASCTSLGYQCGTASDGCGVSLTCGPCPSYQICGSGAQEHQCLGPLSYPTRTTYRLKGLQPDFWSNWDEISGNNVGGVAMNLVWAQWEANLKAPPCDLASEEEYDGHCFVINGPTDTMIREWTSRGLVVTGILYGVPDWARTERTPSCKPPSPYFNWFCAPDHPADYARFAGMIANRYDGLHGNGRVADFVIHNEVNYSDWYDVGFPSGVDRISYWLDTYSGDFNAAYDAITSEQPNAKVLISLEHNFAIADAPNAGTPILSGITLINGVAARASGRSWRVAFHPYPPNLLQPQFSINDWPKVTYGNIGILAGWLRKNFPGNPAAWEIQLTESGINCLERDQASQQAQSDWLCRAMRNIVGTPGIESYIYHRMTDNADETQYGLAVGLHYPDLSFKQAWVTWALSNRSDLNPPQLSCGFEDLPYIRLTRFYSPSQGRHWVSTRHPSDGFTNTEASWRLLREPLDQTKLLYECLAGDHNIITDDANCENLQPMGPLGYSYTSAVAGAVRLYRCQFNNGTDHFVTTAANCETTGWQLESTDLGYAMP